MRKENFSYKLILLLGFAFISVPMICAEEHKTKQETYMLPGVGYWELKLKGMIKGVQSHKNGTVTGEYQTLHGYIPFRAKQEEIENPNSKTKAYLTIVEETADNLVDIEQEIKKEKKGSRQLFITVFGEDYEKAEGWKNYYADKEQELVEMVESSRNWLKSITGENFETREEWERWLDENRKYLQYSEKLKRLEIIKPK